jgi:hypothetical protein
MRVLNLTEKFAEPTVPKSEQRISPFAARLKEEARLMGELDYNGPKTITLYPGRTFREFLSESGAPHGTWVLKESTWDTRFAEPVTFELSNWSNAKGGKDNGQAIKT